MFGITNKPEVVAKSLYDDKVTELSLAHVEIAKLHSQVKNLIDTQQELHEQLTRQEATHKTAIDRINKSVNSRVNDALASVGVSQFAVETIYNSNVESSPEQIMRKYNSLNAEDRHEFYKQHKDVIEMATRTGIRSVKP